MLSRDEKTAILKTINTSLGFTNYTEKELDYYINSGKIVTLRKNGNLVGIVTEKTISKSWSEISTLVVLKKYRNQGNAKKLLSKMLKKLRNKNLYIMAYNPITKNLALKNNFQKRLLFKLPLPIKKYLLQTRLTFKKTLGFFKKRKLKLSQLEHFIKPCN